MRKLMCLMLLLSGLSLVACGSDGGDDDNEADGDGDGGDGDGTDGDSDGVQEEDDPITGDGDGDGTGEDMGEDEDGIDIPEDGSDGDGEPEVKYPDCDRSTIPDPIPGFMGTLEFTQAEFMACQEMCGQMQACYTEANCPGLDNFDECANAEIFACTASSATGKCRIQLENAECCIRASGCGETDQACWQSKCGEDITAFQGCAMNDPCGMDINGIVGKCIATDEAPTNPGTGDGTTGGASNISIAAMKNVLQSTALRQSLAR